ncbi:KRFJ protein, partial [Pomatostomus ruficeps]|nr:KRFJ protein [Pomatostomus ruficeps]
CLPGGGEVVCPEPCTYTRSLGPVVASCEDSTALVYGPPVSIIFPGPIMNTCPQQSVVASSAPQTYGASYGSGSGGSYGGLSRIGSSYGSGGSYGSGVSYGSGGSGG